MKWMMSFIKNIYHYLLYSVRKLTHGCKLSWSEKLSIGILLCSVISIICIAYDYISITNTYYPSSYMNSSYRVAKTYMNDIKFTTFEDLKNDNFTPPDVYSVENILNDNLTHIEYLELEDTDDLFNNRVIQVTGHYQGKPVIMYIIKDGDDAAVIDMVVGGQKLTSNEVNKLLLRFARHTKRIYESTNIK